MARIIGWLGQTPLNTQHIPAPITPRRASNLKYVMQPETELRRDQLRQRLFPRLDIANNYLADLKVYKWCNRQLERTTAAK